MIQFNTCPRCKGAVSIDWDHYGWYEYCVQCGYVHDLATITEVEERLTEKERNKVRILRKHKG